MNSSKKAPHVFVILLLLVFLSSIITHLIPAGTFERVKDMMSGQTLVLPDSYIRIKNTPVSVWNIPMKFFEACIQPNTAKLIFFILFISGSFEIFMQTQSINIVFEVLARKCKKRRIWIIPIFVTAFSILGFTMGLSTASIIFVPIGILTARKLGYDDMTGISMVMLGTNAGFAAGVYNPFTVGIAQTIAEVPIYSGAWIRWLLLLCLLIVTSIYIMKYTYKNSSFELNMEQMKVSEEGMIENRGLSKRQCFVLVTFIISFVILILGISIMKWKVNHIAVLFLIMGIISGLTYGFSTNEICGIFVNGCKKMMTGVFVIGLAATMRLILSDGHIIDTIAYYLTGFAYHFPDWAKLMGMFYGNAVLDLLITSGSAHAAVAMPIMLPMVDFLGVSRQGAVFAFQLGDGLVNLCSPISTTLTSVLAISGLSYNKWVRFFFPLVAIYLFIGSLFIVLAGVVGY